MNINQAEERFKELKELFTAGDLTETEFKAKLEELMVQDEGGNWWMIGYETERWYRYDGTNWVQADPPGRRAREPAAVAVPAPEEAQSRPAEAAVPVQAVQKKADAPVMPAAPAPRRSPLMFVAAALVLLSVGGYFVFRSAGSKPPGTPTAGTSMAIVAKPTQAATFTAEPTAEPSQTPTPGIEFVARAAASRVILYQGPDLRYGQVKSYPKGENFAVLARDPDAQWLLVSASDGNQGWVYFQWVEADFDLSLLPTPAVAPPPLPPATRKPKDNKPTPCSFGC